jgi:hypothetical protein
MVTAATTRVEQLARLRRLYREAEGLRAELGVSAPGAIIFRRPLTHSEDVTVTADGDGGADLEIVSGNFPVRYTRVGLLHFDSESEACAAAERLATCPCGGGRGDDAGVARLESALRGGDPELVERRGR